jgi:hypothetical protein
MNANTRPSEGVEVFNPKRTRSDGLILDQPCARDNAGMSKR